MNAWFFVACVVHFIYHLNITQHHLVFKKNLVNGHRPSTFLQELGMAEMGDRLATMDMGRNVAAVPLSVWGELGPHVTMSPGPRPTSVLSGILIHPAVWPQ